MDDHRVDAAERGGPLGESAAHPSPPGRRRARRRPRRRASRRPPRAGTGGAPRRAADGWPGPDRGPPARRPGVPASRPAPRPSPRGGRPGPRGSGSRAGRGTRRADRASRRYRSGRARRRTTRSDGPATTPAMTSLWPPRNFVADSTTRSAPELQRPADVRRRERVVDDVGRPVSMGELGEGRVIGDVRRRVGDRLRVEDPRRGGGEGRRDRVEVGRVDDLDRDAEPAEDPEQLLSRRAVGGQRGDDPVAGPQQRGERGVDRAHPRRERGARRPARQLGVGAARARRSSGSRSGCRRTRRAVR